MRLSESIGQKDGMDRDAKKNDDMMLEQCTLNATIKSLRQKNRCLERLTASLSDELCQKNRVICKMSRCSLFVDVVEVAKEEQERSLTMATELSVAYAESQMKMDKLTEIINQLQLERIQKSDAYNSVSTRMKSYQSEESAPSKFDGINKHMSTIFSQSFNASSTTGLDTSCNTSHGDSRSVKADVLSMSIPKIDFTFSLGNASGLKITKPSTGWNNAAVPTKSNQNDEKVIPYSSLADQGGRTSRTSKHDVRSSLKDIWNGTTTVQKDRNGSGISDNSSYPDGRPSIISI
jgi:hypothetical protein